MKLDADHSQPYAITVLLLEQFAMIALASTIEPFREANWILGRQAYQIRIASRDGNPVTSSSGMSIAVDMSMESVSSSSMIIVCSSWDPHLYTTPEIINWLRMCARRGMRIGGVETGAFVLAKAGLLDGYRATVHWENMEAFIESFPRVKVTDSIFELDRSRFSASGASAALDMALYFIEEGYGSAVANAVADGFVYRRSREGSSQQRSELRERLNVKHPRLIKILNYFDKNLDRHIDLAEVARIENVTDREIRRLFGLYLNASPQAYHRKLRLEKARSLLRQTSTSVTEIAVICGFSSSSDFSRAYKRQFSTQPAHDRNQPYTSDWFAGVNEGDSGEESKSG